MANNDPLDPATDGYLGSNCDVATGYCGTGYNQITFPGDPNLNNGYLIARGSFAGITLTWTLPADAHAVAHVRVFRSTVDDFSRAIQIATAGGSYYFDEAGEIETGTRYYYWIQLISINGTEGAVIGSASAVMQATVEQVIEFLEGRITESQLNIDLRTNINNIGNLEQIIDTETAERLQFQDVMDQLYAGLQGQLDAQGTLLYSEAVQRRTEDQALVVKIDGIGATINGDIALIKEEQGVILNVLGDGSTEGLVYDVQQLDLAINDDEGSLQRIAKLEGDINGLEAEYMVKIDLNGYVSGFGLSASVDEAGNTESQFQVNVDTFVIGKPGLDNQFPFIIDEVNGETVIALNAKTMILDGQITTAMIDEFIQSSNYPNSSGPGWFLGKDGTFVLRGQQGRVLLESRPNGTPVWASEISNDQQLWNDIAGDNKPEDNADSSLQNDFTPTIGWTFTADDEDFTANSGSISVRDDYIEFRPFGGNSFIASPPLLNATNQYYVRGARNSKVRARVRFYGSESEWQGALFYKTTTTFNWQFVSLATAPAYGEWTTLEWDMTDESVWRNGTVVQIRLDLAGDNRTNRCDVDWISLGNTGASVTKINSDNVGIFIDNATINTAQIGNAAVDTLQIQGNAVTIPEGASGTTQSSKELKIEYDAGFPPSAIVVQGSVTVTGQNNNSIQEATLESDVGVITTSPGETALFETSQRYTIPVFGIIEQLSGTECTISLKTRNRSSSTFTQVQWNLTAIGAKR